MQQSELAERYSSNSKEALYALAFSHLEKERYRDGELLLYALVMIEPESIKYWKAIAFAQQKQKHYDEACSTYALISDLVPDDPEPYLRAAECYFSKEDRQNGLEALAEADRRISHSPELKRDLDRLKQAWSNPKL